MPSDWPTKKLLAGDAFRHGRERIRLPPRQSGLKEHSICEWGYLERVSTRLPLVKLDKDAALARDLLTVADAWARS
jgi:hypothetical protein